MRGDCNDAIHTVGMICGGYQSYGRAVRMSQQINFVDPERIQQSRQRKCSLIM